MDIPLQFDKIKKSSRRDALITSWEEKLFGAEPRTINPAIQIIKHFRPDSKFKGKIYRWGGQTIETTKGFENAIVMMAKYTTVKHLATQVVPQDCPSRVITDILKRNGALPK